MRARSLLRSTLRGVAACAGVAAGAYAASVAVAWSRYGQPAAAAGSEKDLLLDRFMPAFDVVERHHVRVAAPAATTLDVAGRMDLQQSSVVRALFRTRELVFGAKPVGRRPTRGLLAQVQALGWVVLAEVPGREVVLGAVTRPWEPNPVFQPVAPERFAVFAEPGYVKIAWTLRADPEDDRTCVFRTETRAIATDHTARTRFRTYWAFVSPGIFLIRWVSLAPLKREAERAALEPGGPSPHVSQRG